MDHRLWRLPVLAGACLALLAAPGGAQAAAPAPCNGYFATDKTGDAIIGEDSAGIDGEAPGTPNMDLTGVFLNFRDGKLTVNFQVVDLNKTIPEHTSTTGGIYYYAYFNDAAGDPKFVKAQLNPDGNVTYHFGSVVVVPFLFTAYVTDGDTTGSFDEGPNGVVSVVVPEDMGGTAGGKLGGLFGVIDTIEGEDDFSGINHHADSHLEEPDPGAPNGTDYTVVECPAGEAPAPAAPPTPTEPGSPPPSGGSAPSGGGSGPAKPTSLGIKFPASLGSAKKARKKKGLVFKVTAEKAVRNLRLAVKTAKGKTIASAKIASLKAGRSKIKLKGKKLKAGKYTLIAAGSVDGTALNSVHKVRIKK